MTVTRQSSDYSSPSRSSRDTVRVFGPGGTAQTSCYPRLSALGCLNSLACLGLLCPLLTSPGRSEPVTRLPVLADNRETSRGKAQSCHRVDARCIK